MLFSFVALRTTERTIKMAVAPVRRSRLRTRFPDKRLRSAAGLKVCSNRLRATGARPRGTAGPKRRVQPHKSEMSQPCGAGGVVAGKLRGTPPTETGPIGLGCRAIRLRITADSRLRVCLVGMEEVTSGAIAVCSESTFAISVEI